MRRVSGYVRVRETDMGVPNLVVEVYDQEPRAAVPVKQPRRADLFRRLGQRLGSVLTDTTGHFELTAENLAFAGNESRPDLVLAIFASEDVQSVDRPLPLPPADRLLYASFVPRTNAGAEEAYMIRLLQAQIDKFRIPLKSAESGATGSTQFVTGVQNAWAFKERVRATLKKRLQEDVDVAEQRRKDAHDFFKDLSGIPLHLRDTGKRGGENRLRNNALLIGRRADLTTKLPDLQADVVDEALTRLDEAKTKPRIRLHLSKEDLRGLGLSVTGGKVTGKADSQKVLAAIRRLMSGGELKKVRGLNNPSPEELERRYLSPPAAPTQPEEPPATPKAKGKVKRKRTASNRSKRVTRRK